MYALIYDESDPAKREKKVISVHKTRETAEKALKKRQHKLDKRVWECNTRIVWAYDRVHPRKGAAAEAAAGGPRRAPGARQAAGAIGKLTLSSPAS